MIMKLRNWLRRLAPFDFDPERALVTYGRAWAGINETEEERLPTTSI
jgi:hypothetical protein